MDLSILIVAYKNQDLTRDCLRSVFEQTREASFEVIVVDNASGDGTPDMVEREFPRVQLIRSEINLGFAGANNLAASRASGEYLVLLNPDTLVLDGALDRLLKFARGQEQPGVFGGRTVRPDRTLDPSSCWGTPTPWSAWCFATGLSVVFRHNPVLDPESLGSWQRDSVRDVGVVTGCLLLTSSSTWLALGGFDERFFLYGEDTDLSIRARQLGLRVCITPAATVVHVVGASSATSGDKMALVMRGKITVMDKHWAPTALLAGRLGLLTGVFVRSAASRALRLAGRRTAPSFWEAVWNKRADWLTPFPIPEHAR
jgi:hypothetical protein